MASLTSNKHVSLEDKEDVYPFFQPNQVLTSGQLNSLSDYLEQQGRLTRQACIGIGIVCGLDISTSEENGGMEVLISKGVGITSEGYLIRLDETTSVCTHVRDFEARNYPSTGDQYALLELLEEQGNDPNESRVLKDDDVNDKVVMLYLDIQEITTDTCRDDSCDEKGSKWKFTVRKLLVSRNDADNIMGKAQHEINNSDDFFNHEYQLPDVSFKRFGFPEGNTAKLHTIDSLNDFVDAYYYAIKENNANLSIALNELYRLFEPLFGSQSITVNPFTDELFYNRVLNAVDQNRLSAQYIYDFLLDLKSTYDELAIKLFDLTAICCPSPDLFPRHLMLGELSEKKIGQFSPECFPPSTLRHHFSSAPIYNDQSDLLLNIKQLIHRLVFQIQHFSLHEGEMDQGIKITPSKDCSAPLGKQAIPFYYEADDLIDYWDFESTKRNKAQQHLGYHNQENDESVLNNICNLPKFRIEGHVGMTVGAAAIELNRLRKDYNLPFDVIALKLDPTFDSVYLPDNTKVADLQNIYLTHRNEAVCCTRDVIRTLRAVESSAPNIIQSLLASRFDQGGIGKKAPAFKDILSLFNQYYQQYFDSLQALKDELPLDIKDFNINEFSEAYEQVHSITLLIKYFINTWGDMESSLRFGNKSEISKSGTSEPLSVLLNYINLFLDRISDDCLLSRFVTIYRTFVNRVEKQTIFSTFNENIHGMEHIAGTMKCGTFILVYEDPEERKKISGTITDSKGNAIVSAVVSDSKSPYIERARTNDKGEYTALLPESQREVKIKKFGYYVQNNVDLPVDSNQFGVVLDRWERLKAKDSMVNGEAGLLLSKNEREYVNMLTARLPFDFDVKAPDRTVHNTSLPVDAMVIDFNSHAKFRVVGDFYLPCRIPDCHFEIPFEDSCSELGKFDLIEFQALLEKFMAEIQEERGNGNKGAGVGSQPPEATTVIDPGKGVEGGGHRVNIPDNLNEIMQGLLEDRFDIIGADRALIISGMEQLNAQNNLTETYEEFVNAKIESKKAAGDLSVQDEIMIDAEILAGKRKLLVSKKKVAEVKESLGISGKRHLAQVEEIMVSTEAIVKEEEALIEKAKVADVTSEKAISLAEGLVKSREALFEVTEKYRKTRGDLGASKEEYRAVNMERIAPALEGLKLAKEGLLEMKVEAGAPMSERVKLEKDLRVVDIRIADVKREIG